MRSHVSLYGFKVRSWMLVLLVAMLTAPAAQAQRAGVLLGIAHSGTSEACPQVSSETMERYECYRSYWIAPKAGGAQGDPSVVHRMEGLVIPRSDGWWRVDARPYLIEKDGEPTGPSKQYRGVHVAAAPVGEALAFPPRSATEARAQTCWKGAASSGDGLDSHVKVLYAGNDYVSLSMRDDGYCGGARMIHYVSHSTLLVDSLQTPNDSYSEHRRGYTVPNPLSTPRISRMARDRVERILRGMVTSSNVSTYVDRVPGRWWTHAAPSGQWHIMDYEEFRLAPAPSSVVGPDELPVSMEGIRRVVPDASDAVAAPNRAFLLVLTSGHRLVAVRFGEDGTLDRASRHEVAAFDEPVRLVGVQWALGRHVDRWTEALSGL